MPIYINHALRLDPEGQLEAAKIEQNQLFIMKFQRNILSGASPANVNC